MNQTPERKLAAIMFTDIAGYTALSAKDETSPLNLLDTQKQILTPIIKEFNGTLHKEIMLISSKLNSTDRKRFFAEHKWVSQIVENWEKVK